MKHPDDIVWGPGTSHTPVEDMVGKTFTEVYSEHDFIVFSNEYITYYMYHEQDCCESVTIEDINGDLNDLIGLPILKATEDSNVEEEEYGHVTYTFYHIRTLMGTVTIRWHGSSNGYYSERVDMLKIDVMTLLAQVET